MSAGVVTMITPRVMTTRAPATRASGAALRASNDWGMSVPSFRVPRLHLRLIRILDRRGLLSSLAWGAEVIGSAARVPAGGEARNGATSASNTGTAAAPPPGRKTRD